MSATTKAARGPSWTEVILGALLSVVLGALLGAVFLVLSPVETVKALPQDPSPHAVYLVEGSHDSTKARTAPAKAKAFFTGSSVVLTEDEVNALIAVPAKPPAKAAGKPAAPEASGGAITPGEPNVRIRDGVLQIGVPIHLNVLGFEPTVIAQARGTFVRSNGGFVLSPDEFYVGACPLHRFPGVAGWVFRRFVAAAKIRDEVAIAWGNLSDVTVEGSTLRLTMP